MSDAVRTVIGVEQGEGQGVDEGGDVGRSGGEDKTAIELLFYVISVPIPFRLPSLYETALLPSQKHQLCRTADFGRWISDAQWSDASRRA
jgi:hypothetical protein